MKTGLICRRQVPLCQAASGLFFAIRTDHHSLVTFAVYAVGFCAVSSLGWALAEQTRIRSRLLLAEKPAASEPIHPGEIEPTLNPGVRLHLAPSKHPFNRWVITLIVLTVVSSAVSGYWYVRTAINADKNVGHAFEELNEIVRSVTASGTADELGKIATAEELLVRHEAALQRVFLAENRLANVRRGDADRDEKQLHDSLKEYQHEMQILGNLGPLQSHQKMFGRFAYQRFSGAADRAFAMWDALNETSEAWHKKADIYLATLTLFAIALYLFGQSLSLGATSAAFILVFFSFSLTILGAGRADRTKHSASNASQFDPARVPRGA